MDKVWEIKVWSDGNVEVRTGVGVRFKSNEWDDVKIYSSGGGTIIKYGNYFAGSYIWGLRASVLKQAIKSAPEPLREASPRVLWSISKMEDGAYEIEGRWRDDMVMHPRVNFKEIESISYHPDGPMVTIKDAPRIKMLYGLPIGVIRALYELESGNVHDELKWKSAIRRIPGSDWIEYTGPNTGKRMRFRLSDVVTVDEESDEDGVTLGLSDGREWALTGVSYDDIIKLDVWISNGRT